MDFETISRRESRKRRRLSERRRLFSNQLARQSQMSLVTNAQDTTGGDYQPPAPRSDSPIGGDQRRISMKIQFHITVAPENEPLIMNDHDQSIGLGGQQQQDSQLGKPPVTSSIGEQIQEKLNLSRQNSINSSSSTRRRQQRLLAMHNSSNTTTSSGIDTSLDTPPGQTIDEPMMVADTVARSDDNLIGLRRDSRQVAEAGSGNTDAATAGMLPPISGGLGREAGARSSTITGGMADEATVRFLQQTSDNHHLAKKNPPSRPQQYSSASNLSTSYSAGRDRERIYFKRDGQRFGNEFTLKLAVDRTYRCLLKVRPLIPLQSISIQGHQLLFVDCSQQQRPAGGGSAPSSTTSSTSALNQRLRSGSAVMASAVPSRHLSQPINDAYLNKHSHPQNHHHHQIHHHNHNHHNYNHNHNHHNHNHNHQHQHHNGNHLKSHPMGVHAAGRPGLYHAQTTGSLYRASLTHQDQPQASSKFQLQLAESTSLYRQQQNQMMRHFAASYCSSSNSHLGNQLIYMFDWPASRFEVNKNKNRTQVQTVLKFKNGQILSLPLQVKFYQSECRQHLEWGSQLHFIDYDCQINQLGTISVDRVQYY